MLLHISERVAYSRELVFTDYPSFKRIFTISESSICSAKSIGDRLALFLLYASAPILQIILPSDNCHAH